MTVGAAEKIYQEVKELRKETEFLKNVVLSVLGDPEGDYKPSFVRQILKMAAEKPKKLFEFKNAQDFIKHVRTG